MFLPSIETNGICSPLRQASSANCSVVPGGSGPIPCLLNIFSAFDELPIYWLSAEAAPAPASVSTPRRVFLRLRSSAYCYSYKVLICWIFCIVCKYTMGRKQQTGQSINKTALIDMLDYRYLPFLIYCWMRSSLEGLGTGGGLVCYCRACYYCCMSYRAYCCACTCCSACCFLQGLSQNSWLHRCLRLFQPRQQTHGLLITPIGIST